MLNFRLFENIQQAKSFLQKKKVTDLNDFNEISELLSKNPNYIYQFTKFRYQDKIDMEDIKKVIDTIRNKKEIISLLKRNLIDYTNFEELIDDMTKANYKSIVNKFLTEAIWYKKFRTDLKIYLTENPEKENIVLDFLKLNTELQKQFLSTLKYYKINNVNSDFFMDEMEKFIENKSLRSSEIIEKLKKYSDLLNIVYNNENIIIITTRNKQVVKEFGSQKWCIVYNDNFFNSYIGNKATQQYICFNLNIPQSDYNSLFGITVEPDGSIKYGARQDSDNDTKDMSYIVKSLSVGVDIFKPLNDKELAELDPICLINSNITNKLTKNQISKLDIDTKIKHKLLEESEIKTLDAVLKVKNGYIHYLTNEDLSKLSDDIIEKYDITLSDKLIKQRSCGYKMRTGRFNYLSESDIKEINELLDTRFENISEVEKFYKDLNLIDKIQLMFDNSDRFRDLDVDVFDLFFSKSDFINLSNNFEMEILENDIEDLLGADSLDILYLGDDSLYDTNISDYLNLSVDSIRNAFQGFEVRLDNDELNYIHFYINKENWDIISEEFGLSEYDLEKNIGTVFFVLNFLQDKRGSDLLGNLSYDMDNVGNKEYRKFIESCPIEINGDLISINFTKLLNFLDKENLTNIKSLSEWASSGLLFYDNNINYEILNEDYPSLSSDKAENFNDQLKIYLDNYEGDKKILRKLLDLGFRKSSNYFEGLVLNKKSKSSKDIYIDIYDISTEGVIFYKYNSNNNRKESDLESFIDFIKNI